MFDWIKPREATVADLEEQMEAATIAKADADRRYDAAIAAFDADPTSGATKALSQARESAQVAADHVGRAERLLAAAKDRERARLDAEARARIKSLQAEIDGALKARRNELAEQEADAFAQVVDVHHQRLLHERHVVRLQHEIRSLKLGVGESVPELRVEPTFIYGIDEQLRERALRLNGDDPRRRWLISLTQTRFD